MGEGKRDDWEEEIKERERVETDRESERDRKKVRV